jgi:ADP-ribose pyrophosphatase YjhB (NUDIX family)
MNKEYYQNIRLNEQEDWKKKTITPRIAVVGVVESIERDSLLIIDRIYEPYGFSFPGGMMDVGETIEETAKREVEEETGISANCIGLLNVSSNPELDQRWHVVIIHVLMRAIDKRNPVGTDDAKWAAYVDYECKWLKDTLIKSAQLALDDYLQWRRNEISLPKLQ